MAVEYEISSDVATIKDVAPNTQVARVVSLYSGQITYDDEAGSKFATATIDGKSQRVMLCIAVNGTVNYDDVPSLYSTVDGHRCLNIVAPTGTGTPDDVPSVYETVVIDGMNVRAVRCILINETPIYDGVSSTCTFVANGKTHTAQLVNKITGGSVDVIVKGVSPLVLPDAIANSLSYVKAFGGTEQNGTPTPTAPKNIVCNNGTIKVRRQSGLPLDYQKITFVRPDESIDLGIKTTDNTQITTEFYREENIAQYLYFSDSGSTLTTNTTAYTSTGNANWRFGNRTANVTTPVTTKTTYVQNKNGVSRTSPTEDSWGYTSVNSFTSTNNLKTGASPSTSTEGNIRYYSILVEESGVAVLDLIPVRRLSDDKVGFYNLVNGDFFEATGNVVRGGDIADPVEIYADGTVETINAPSKNLFDKNSSLVNGYINSSGAAVSGNALKVSPFIEIKPNTTYTLSGTGNVKVLSYDRYAYTYTAEQTPIAQVPSKTGGASATFTTAQNAKYIRIQITPDAVNTCQLELGSTATEYQPYFDGGTATAEMLLKVGDYTDVQEILSGKVKRNVGIKVLDGTENFETATATNCYSLTTTLGTGNFSDRTIYCTHFGNTPTQPAVGDRQGLAFITNKGTDYTIAFGATTQFSTQSVWKQWLAAQYAAGTPVIVVYPLATETTESVAGQTLQVQAGDNTLEITQASLSNLELEAKYHAGVSLTVEEVEDANLDPDVQVTIN